MLVIFGKELVIKWLAMQRQLCQASLHKCHFCTGHSSRKKRKQLSVIFSWRKQVNYVNNLTKLKANQFEQEWPIRLMIYSNVLKEPLRKNQPLKTSPMSRHPTGKILV